jgi:hypothetical protein
MNKVKKHLQPSLIYLFGSIGVFMWSFWTDMWLVRIAFILFSICFFLLYLSTHHSESNNHKEDNNG